MGLGAVVGIVVVTQLGFVKSSNTGESEKSSNISESENSTTSSDPEEFYIDKGADGSKIYIKPEDVSCEPRLIDKAGEYNNSMGYYYLADYVYVECRANGYSMNLADEKHVIREFAICASTDQKYKQRDGTLQFIPGYNSKPFLFTCVAAEKYEKYQRQDYPSGNARF